MSLGDKLVEAEQQISTQKQEPDVDIKKGD